MGGPVWQCAFADIDFAEYLLKPGALLSLAAFDLRAQSKWAAGWDGTIRVTPGKALAK